MRKLTLFILSIVMLCACHASKPKVNLEKYGELYSILDRYQFYYPRDWKVSKDDEKIALDIFAPNGNEALYFDVYTVYSTNSPEEIMTLYVQDLKQISTVVEENWAMNLASGQLAYYLSGKDQDGQRFVEVVLPNTPYLCCYTYIAKESEYEKNAETMKAYVMSLSVNNQE